MQFTKPLKLFGFSLFLFVSLFSSELCASMRQFHVQRMQKWAAREQCGRDLNALAWIHAGERPLRSIHSLRVGTLNAFGWYRRQGFFSQVNGEYVRRSGPENTSAKSRRQLAKFVLDEQLDILTVQEVAFDSVERIAREDLQGLYKPFIVRGNDSRNIQIAFFVRKNLPFDIEIRSHKDERWDDPVLRENRLLFSRDLPALIFRAEGKELPLMYLHGTHFKSKRTRHPNDPQSGILRRAQILRADEIVSVRYQEEFDEVPYIIAGDFNGDLRDQDEFDPFYRSSLLDSFNEVEPPIEGSNRTTFVFFRNGRKFRQLDGNLLSPFFDELILEAYAYRWRNKQGNPIRFPRTPQERAKLPSDHYPAIVEFAFQPIVEHWERRIDNE